MQAVALVAAVASGAAIALQNLVFGEFITVITSFTSGASSPSDLRAGATRLA
jgi:ATP-binding cassette, subfamily B (MDR/TAP), member 1